MRTEQSVLSGPSVDEAALASLAPLAPQLVLVFGSVDSLGQPGFLEQLKAACPQARPSGRMFEMQLRLASLRPARGAKVR